MIDQPLPEPESPPTMQKLEDLYAMRDLLMMNKQAQINQIIPQSVQDDLTDLEAEYGDKEDKLAARIESAEAFLKAQTVAAGAKTIGANFYVQYTKPSKQVKVEDLLRVADRYDRTHPEIAAEMRAIITLKKASAAIKPVGT